MTPKEIAAAVTALDEIDTEDPEHAHSQADGVLLKLVPVAVASAYDRVKERSRWWASA